MVNYFKELERPSNQFLDLIDTSLIKKDIELNVLPSEFFGKFSQLFLIIKNYDLLFEFNSKDKKLYLNSDSDCSDIPLEWVFSSYINGYGLDDSVLSKNGIDKIDYLLKKFEKGYTGDNLYEDLEVYFMAIYDQFRFSDNGINSSKNCILDFLSSAKTMAKYQNKLSKENERLFDDAINYIKNYKIKIPHREFEPIRMYLPNSWYITPYNHLYNTMGPDGHKEANLVYPLYYSIVRDDCVENPYNILRRAKKILNNGWIDNTFYQHYTNLKYDFISIYPQEYYTLNNLDKLRYRMISKRTYNPKIIKLVMGIMSAQAGLYSFFYYLKQNSSDYYADLDYIKDLRVDDILVRCCGFHKVSSISSKTITTSCVNYEEEFREYIDRGWNIDFVKPIILNPDTKRVEEYSDDILLIRKMHCHKK